MIINDTDINNREVPYLIAEIGVNHFDIAEKEGLSAMEAAKQMVSEAAEAGADAVKFQSYSADRLASKHSPAYWNTDEESTTNQYELFSQYDDFGASEFEDIARWTGEHFDIDFLSTPFDFQAVDYLENIVPAYKIASADITNHPLLRAVARTGKPILLSTGASTIGEIDDAVKVIESEATDLELSLLHCILQYPTKEENANLGMIRHLSEVYPEYTIGYSDHVPPDEGMVTLLNATVQGAEVIEKHFTTDKSIEGNDHYHAMGPDDIRTFRANADRMATTTGQLSKAPIEAEADSRKHARRSLVAREDIEVGEEITRDHLAIKRPGTGISPTMLEVVLGREVQEPIKQDELLRWDSI